MNRARIFFAIAITAVAVAVYAIGEQVWFLIWPQKMRK